MNKNLMLASAAVLALTAGIVRAASQLPAATPNSVTSSAPAAPQAPAGIVAKGEPAGQEQAEATEPAGQEQAEANEPAGQDTDNVQDGDQSGADGGVEAPEAPVK